MGRKWTPFVRASSMSSGLNRLRHFFSVSAYPTITSDSPRGGAVDGAPSRVAIWLTTSPHNYLPASRADLPRLPFAGVDERRAGSLASRRAP